MTMNLHQNPPRDERGGRRANRIRIAPEDLEPRQLLSTFDFPKPLQAEIAKLNTAPTTSDGLKKAFLLQKAYSHLPAGFVSSMKAYKLDPVTNGFVLKDGAGGTPAYFSKPFVNHPPRISATSDFYDYKDKNPGQANAFWVDFANQYLGGGVFSSGFVQEEVMFLETPELANAAATKSVDTRIPNDAQSKSAAGLLQGSPQPWLFTNVERVMSINTAAIGKFQDASKDVLDKNSTILAVPQNFNVVAIAAPKLDSTKDQTSLPVVEDLFNSFVAGFSLAKAHASVEFPLVNTGAIGAGAFNNSRTVVYVLQDLAVRYLGLNIQWWGYDASTAAHLEDTYVGPILSRYATDAAANPAMNTVKHLLEIASSVLTPKPGGAMTPAVTTEAITAIARRQDRLGRPAGAPLVGFTFTFNTAMDPSSLAAPRNYRISYAVQRSVRGRTVTAYRPVPILSVAADPDGSSVTITTRSTRARYAQGGLVLLNSAAGGLTSQDGVALGGDSSFTIAPKASGIIP